MLAFELHLHRRIDSSEFSIQTNFFKKNHTAARTISMTTMVDYTVERSGEVNVRTTHTERDHTQVVSNELVHTTTLLSVYNTNKMSSNARLS